MMSLTFGLFAQVSDSGPHDPLVFCLDTSHSRFLKISFHKLYEHKVL